MAKLEKVLGCTAISRASLSVDENKGIIAYPAGSTVVLHNPKTNAQAHLIGTTKNSVTCLSFSKCGRFLVTGEYGHDPKVRVWEIYDQNAQFSPEKVAELKLHKFGVVCVRFTYDGNKVISVGNEYDKTIAVSDWRKQTVVLENRLTSRVNALDISEQGNYYVTVGVRHVKFWYVTKKATSSGVVPLQGRSAILAEQRNNTFVDVCCASNNRTFSITETNLLVEFRDKKLTGTYDLHGEMPRSLVLGGNEIFIGFNNGTIRCLDVDSMGHKFSYCKPHFLKCDVSKGTKNEVFLPGSHPPGCRYPDVRALCYNKSMGVLTAIYSDRSIYNWQRLDNGNRLTKLSSQLFHVGAIYGVETYPPTFPWLPPGSFISVGADDTIRIWNIDHRTKHFQSDACLPPLQTNVYSEELKKILFVSESVNSLVENSEDVLGASLNDSTTGLRTLRLSPDGRHLAVGGKDGNIYVFDLTVDGMPQIVSHEAHENDVTCLEYSDPTSARYLLASGGRDRLVHLFDPADNYTPLATVDDHTSALNSIVFYPSPDGLELITCAADRLLVVRKLEESADDSVCFFRVNQISAPFGLNNVTMVGSNIIAACQDRQLRSYSLNGKLVKQVKGGISDEGQLTRLKLDPSKTVAATVSTDRSVYVVDAASGECGAVLLGQSDPVTDVAFTLDCRRLIVVSHSGCVFVWRLSNLLSSKMGAKLKKTAISTAVQRPCSTDKSNERSETPDSLIGSGSDVASEDISGTSRYKLKDSESEFGSLSSLKLADEDDDSCIGQKPAKVVLNQVDISSVDNDAFELKRVSTEVVHRSSSALSVSNSQWDVLPTANEEENSTNKNVLVGVTSSHINQPGTSNMHVSSRSMSNLRCGGTANLSVASPKRIRKKWDMMNEGTSEFSDSGFFSRKVPDTGMNSIPFINNNNSPGLPPTPQSQFIQHNSNFSNSDPQKYMHKKMTVVATDDQAHNSYLAASKQIDDAFQDLVQPKVSTPESNFDRCSSSRCSLTKRYMNTSFPNDEPRSVCTPGTISTRRATMNTQYSSESPSNSFRRQSDVHEQGTPRLYQQNGAVEGTFSEDGKSVRRARTIHRLKQRRSTLGAADSSILDSHKDDDYMMSDLYLRSRSQSPSHLALNALNEGRDDQRRKMDSEAALSPSLASSRLVPSSSRKNLRSAEVTSKLNEIRDHLRKSHENLAGALSGEMTPLSSVMFRSRSIGNLRFSTPFSVNNQQSEMFDSRTGLDSLTRARELSDNARKDVESQNLLSSHSRLMARSVGSLHSHDSIDSGSGESGNMHLNQRKVGSRLARTMENLKKASNPDLTHQSLYECSVSSENYCVPVFPSVSRFTQQGKGAVQKRVERYQPRNRISRDTTSGESDSNASDVNTATTLHGVGVNGGFAVPKRYFSPLSESNRCTSSVEIPARFGLIQNTKRMFEQQRHNSSGTLRRVPNYLAQKLSLGGTSNSDVGPEEFPRLSNASSEVTSLRDFTGKTFEATKMARHIAECLEQFNTVLDKVLQARQLLESTQDFPPDDKDKMLRVLNQTLRTGRKRLETVSDCIPENAETVNNNVNNPLLLKQNTLISNSVSSPDFQTSVDPVTFIQRYGDQLLALVKNQARQN